MHQRNKRFMTKENIQTSRSKSMDYPNSHIVNRTITITDKVFLRPTGFELKSNSIEVRCVTLLQQDIHITHYVTRGGHSIVKLKTTCKQSLLPLYYMPKIIFKFIIFFYIYITIDSKNKYIFLKFFVIFFCVVIVLVQFCVILVRNGMFYIKKIHQIQLLFFTMS